MKRAIISILAMMAGIQAFCCTNFLIGKDASADGSTMLSYNMDNYGMFTRLKVIPGGDHAPGEMTQVWNYDDHIPMGYIPQAAHTYRVVGFINEKQLSIVESTFVGRKGQENPDGLLHYTCLMELALQRASTAREAIKVMTELVAEYGYASSGESFSIADPEEVWILEMIGKGADEKGAVWVAIRIPDDCICAHANQSRIHRFDMKDKKNVMYSKDVVSYARRKGFFSGKDSEFDFADAYCPADFHTQRACDARAWSFFNMFVDGMERYLDFVDGMHVGASEVMPLYFRPNRKITLREIMDGMRDHYDGTPFDMNVDCTGGAWESPYRPRPQEWEVDGKTYFHERPIATQQSACTMVCQMRGDMPDDVGGVLWFGNDDAHMIAYTPVYCSSLRSPACYNDPAASDIDFSWDSAFWVCNWVSNMAYQRYSKMYPDVRKVREELQDRYAGSQHDIEQRALAMADPAQRAEFLTSYGEACASEMLSRWKELGIFLIVKYNDMATKPEVDGKFLTTEEGRGVPPLREGYPEGYRRVIAEMTGDRYLSPVK